MLYENMQTGEIVLEEEAEEYVKKKLGIEIKPVGKAGEYTVEQLEAKEIITEWYFSDVWIKRKIKNELYG